MKWEARHIRALTRLKDCNVSADSLTGLLLYCMTAPQSAAYADTTGHKEQESLGRVITPVVWYGFSDAL